MKNKYVWVTAVAIIAIIAVAALTTNAQISNSKTGVAGDNVKLLEASSTKTEEMGSLMIKMPNEKDLVISVSAEAILFTDTTVKGNKNGDYTTDMDTASIQVWAEVDGDGTAGTEDDAFPGPVTFAERIQTMKGRLSNVITEPCDENGDGTISNTEECWIEVPEEVQLMLDTTNANSFNFIVLDVPTGEHTVTVYATLSTDESGDFTNDSPKAAIGKRTIVVQEIRLTQGTTI